jgi:hypothetical protein
MNRALWVLLRLRYRAWLRRQSQKMHTLRGASLAGFGAILLCMWILSLIAGPSVRHLEPGSLERYGALVLLGYSLVVIFVSSGGKAVSFTPAEVNFLFSGPFSRRGLLVYKIISSLALSSLSAGFMMFLLHAYTRLIVAGFLGLVLASAFLHLLSMAVSLAVITLEAHAYNGHRKFALAALFGVALLIVLQASGEAFPVSAGEFLTRAEESPVLQLILEPLSWYARAFAAPHVWPDLVQWSLMALAVNGALAVAVIGFDTQYLEAASIAGERVYARQQRIRSAGSSVQLFAPVKGVFSLPSLPWWGGLGPIAWRQLLSAIRSVKGLLLYLCFFGALLLWPFLFEKASRGITDLLGEMTPAIVIMATLFISSIIAFDFRADIDRMDVLKSMPIAPYGLSFGQLVTPVILATIFQLFLVAFLAAVWRGLGWLALFGVIFIVPFNVLLFGVDNLLFLLFPSRFIPTPGDFLLMGQQLLVSVARCFTLTLMLILAALPAGIVYFVGGDPFALLFAAWLGLASAAAGLVWFVAQAFCRFDVARSTPP